MITIERHIYNVEKETDSYDEFTLTSWDAAEHLMETQFQKMELATCIEEGRYKSTGQRYIKIKGIADKSRRKILYEIQTKV